MIGAKDNPDQDLRFDSKPADQITTKVFRKEVGS